MCQRCTGFKRGNTAGLKDGAYSPRQIKARARAHRRRFLRHAGLKASDLDAIEVAYLDGWAQAKAFAELFDASDPQRDPRDVFTALNSARLSMGKLEARMRVNGRSPAKAKGEALRAHLAESYGDAADESR